MKFKLLRKNTKLKADGKTLVFNNGILDVKKITKDIQFLIDAGYIKEEKKNGKSNNN